MGFLFLRSSRVVSVSLIMKFNTRFMDDVTEILQYWLQITSLGWVSSIGILSIVISTILLRVLGLGTTAKNVRA
jgi:hypothetical protein